MRSTGLMNGRLTNASLLAIAAMLVNAPASVQAQSFDAVPTLVAGGATITQAPNLTTVEVTLPSAVINWVPNAAVGSGPINFQPVGTTALFTSRDEPTYAVLNRIQPTSAGRPVVFNGTVISQVENRISGTISRGGTLFFYSPGGIIVGPTGVFNVGNLALTASDVPYNASTGSFGTLGQFSFLPANAGSSVEIQAGAQITAGPFASYVALVAPKVVNSGTITADGATVLVAADASTITFRPNGLYDIQIDQGTSATGEVVTNDGTITGSAGTVNSAHRVYMVAVPRNDAITMAIKSGSALGFDIAQAALVEENAIVLSAGYDVQDGQIAATRQAPQINLFSAADTDLEIGAINATSQVTGKATGQAALTVAGGNTAEFASNLLLFGVGEPGSTGADGAFISVAGVGSVLDITGDLSVTALDVGHVTSGVFSDSGKARIVVDRGSLAVGGTAVIDASRAPLVEVDALGGQASLIARNGAAVQIGGDLVLNATGAGKSATDSSPSGPTTGTGGNAKLAFESGANLTIDGNLTVQANGLGGGSTENGLAGTNGRGGNAIIEGLAGAGTLTVTGTTLLEATGVGGDGQYCFSCTIEGGIGSGGGAGITAASGAQFAFGGALTINASGLGGAATLDGGKDGGGAFGGGAFVISTGGGITANGGVLVLAEGSGGLGAQNDSGVSGSTGIGGFGGGGTGGSAAFAAGDSLAIGGNGTISVVGTTLVSGNGIGGLGYTGAAGQGGSATVSARNGQVSGAGLVVRAVGLGGGGFNGGKGGAGIGGSAEVLALSAIEGVGRVTFGSATLTALGTGGTGGTPVTFFEPGGLGGMGTGGTVRALAEAGNGVLTLAITNVIANGVGGTGGLGGQNFSGPGGVGGVGGIGQGGVAAIGVISGLDTGAINTGLVNLGSTTVQASGLGGAGGNGGPGGSVGTDGNGGRGGNAGGGGAAVFARGGRVNLSAAAQIVAGALGGSGGVSGTGTAGLGGNAVIGDGGSTPDARGAQLIVGRRAGHPDQRGTLSGAALSFTAQAQGGSGSAAGTATNLGRPLAFLLDGGSVNASSLTFAASGTTASGAPPSAISLAGGNTTLTGAFSFITPGTLTAALGGADLLASSATVSASDWLEGLVPPGSAGTIRGTTSVVFSTGGDLFSNLSAQTDGSLVLGAGGRVRLDNLTATGSISVNAGTTLSLGNLSAGSTVSVTASGNVSVGTVAAGGDVALTAGAALSVGGITSRQSVQLSGPGSVTLAGNVIAGASIALSSNGGIAGQGLSAGLVNPSAVSGARYDITAVGLGGIGLGAVAAEQDIKLFTPLALTAGALSGREIALLSGGAKFVGSITATGRVLLADYGMAPIGGDPLGSYDIGALLGAEPISSGGAITVSGATMAGALRARSTRGIAVRAITTSVAGGASGFVELKGGGAIAGGVIVAAGTVNIISDSLMDLVSVASGGALSLDAGQALTAGPILAQGEVIVTGFDRVALGSVRSLAAGVGVTAPNGLTSGPIRAGTSISLTSTAGGLTTGDLATSGGSIGVIAATDIASGLVTSTSGDVALQAGRDLLARDVVSTNRRVVLSAGSAASLGDLTAGGAGTSTFGLRVTAGTTLGLGNVLLGSKTLELTSGGALTGGSLTATAGSLTVTSGGNMTLTGEASSASGDVEFGAGGALSARGITAGGRIGLTVTGAITTAALDATSTLDVTGSGAVTLGAITAQTGGVNVAAVNALQTGAVSAGTSVTLASTAAGVTAGNVRALADTVAVNAAGAASLGSVQAATGISMRSGAGTTLLSGLTDTGDFVLGATGGISSGNLAATRGELVLEAGGALRTGNLAGVSVAAAVGTSLATGAVNATGGAITLIAGGVLTGGDISGDVVSVTGSDAVTLDAITAKTGSVNLAAVNALQTGTVSGGTGVSLASTAAGVTASNLRALAGSVGVNAAGAASLGAVQAATVISVRSGTGLTLLSGLADTGDLVLRSASGITSGTLAATRGELFLEAGGALGTANLANITVAGDLSGAGVTLAANGTLAFGTVTATGGSVSIGTAGAVTGGSITATSVIQQSNLAGAVTLGNLDAGSAIRINGGAGVRIGNAGSAKGTVEVRANAGSLTTSTISATTDAALIASGDLATGSVRARDMVLLAGGSVSTADLVSQTGRILVARDTLGAVGGAIGNFDFGAVFAAPLVAAGGGLTLTGLVSGGAFTAAVAGNAALLGATASRSILAQSGGLLSLGGVLRAPQIELSSNDLAMPAGSGLNAGLTGAIRLISGNADGMRIGDGPDTSILPATSYTLENAEWSRINSGSLSLLGVDGAGPVDMLIGRLDMTGPDAGSTIDDPNGRVLFRTGAVPTAVSTGTIRVTGAIRGTGFRSSNAVVFQTGLFQLSSDTGSINLLGRDGTPLGAVQIEARDIHFAAAPLLVRLAADPFFAGAEAALDNERSGASDAVLRAGALDLLAGRTVYIQRTGSGAVPLGFDEPLDGFSVRPAGTDPVTVIINGTFRAQAGTVSGVNAWQLFKDSGVDLTRFTPESRLNGCLLNAATCSVISPNPDPGIRTLFDLIDVPASDDPEEAEQQSTSPIQAPQVVLAVQPEGLQTQIEEPIAGSGNPALFGSGPSGGLSQ